MNLDSCNRHAGDCLTQMERFDGQNLDAAAARRALNLGELVVVLGTVDPLLKHGLGLVELELCLEVVRIGRDAAAVRAASSIGEVEWLVNDLFASVTPNEVRDDISA